MSLHPPKLKSKPRRERRPPPPLTIGHVLGDQLRYKRENDAIVAAEQRRLKELEAMGFVPIKSGP